jgi:hypothetical protein
VGTAFLLSSNSIRAYIAVLNGNYKRLSFNKGRAMRGYPARREMKTITLLYIAICMLALVVVVLMCQLYNDRAYNTEMNIELKSAYEQLDNKQSELKSLVSDNGVCITKLKTTQALLDSALVRAEQLQNTKCIDPELVQYVDDFPTISARKSCALLAKSTLTDIDKIEGLIKMIQEIGEK